MMIILYFFSEIKVFLFLFLFPPRKNCLTITETTLNNRTKSQPLPKNPNPSWKISTPHPPKKNLISLKISQSPLNFSSPLKFLNPS